ncbi:hypothetical protein [Nannocystis sp. SCPEA4]|uniref:hypothetical protein n=1 Tax=Nannocystis sp. SCPEA4 TaxID=2996787 RepID=UPI00226ED329|nr:hypothetical protein [Nannocystis sp. SCPEA4]MCY1060439.1 hypothetical protein [Nannocystis sp. SCPEA4]
MTLQRLARQRVEHAGQADRRRKITWRFTKERAHSVFKLDQIDTTRSRHQAAAILDARRRAASRRLSSTRRGASSSYW